MKIILLILSIFIIQQIEPTYNFAEKVQLIYNPPKKDYVVLIDYSKPMTEDRLYVYNMINKEMVLKSKVSHAFNSGKKYATEFSNEVGSKKSSIGGFITLNSYYGRWGYSMKIKGVDGILNNNAEFRSIVFHSNITEKTSYSEGCFETPYNINTKLINMVKGGCLIYVYQ